MIGDACVIYVLVFRMTKSCLPSEIVVPVLCLRNLLLLSSSPLISAPLYTYARYRTVTLSSRYIP